MEELAELELALREVADRLARLRTKGESPMPLLSVTAAAGVEPLLFQILQALAGELKEEGARVLVTGVHRAPRGRVSTWYELFSKEDAEKVLTPELVRALEALASLERLRLMLALVSGPAGSAEVMAQSGLTQGQFYHHLRILEGSGMVRRKTRDGYEATLHGASSLFTLLAAA
ncbi:MAG: ArsR family transcriptional regulator, partial [Candidatus Acetothermia bacterium]|nr:ArsR family transcriptional regulator [Candidatus Acetothermia bacterium]